GTTWSGWGPEGGSINDLAVAVNSDGRLEIYTVNMDGSASHIWQTSPSAYNSWSGWSSLGGSGIQRIGVGRNANGNLEAFCIGPGNSLYIDYWNGSVWSGWGNLGGWIRSLA